ncbi:6750_t:CDS:2 [Diversispora eburnea]|uniref:6750_t:CDS:1 n=1 Tax=Diversispora eburnea TaxID=1213867 RepID=A0A9N9G8Q7_9GLOM|nr:6750_t:CDS:2 [Diversispora eburnea]
MTSETATKYHVQINIEISVSVILSIPPTHISNSSGPVIDIHHMEYAVVFFNEEYNLLDK